MDGTMNKAMAEQALTFSASADLATAETSVAAAGIRLIEDGEIRRMRERIERQFRTNRTLGRMVRKLLVDRAEARPVEVVPKLPVATLAQQPLRRPRSAEDPWWPAGPLAPAPSLSAPAGHDCYSIGDAIDETVGISVLGLAGEDLERVVTDVADQQLQHKGFKPVFLTDQPDFLPFVSRGYAFEYLSDFRSYLDPDPDEARSGRLSALVRKWGLSEVVSRDGMRGPNRGHAPLAGLIRHNTGMSQACHRDRFQWVVETLRIALATERYDVAEPLAEYVLTFFDTLSKANQGAAARVLCRKFIAFGEGDRLRRFLFKNIAQVKKDDSLFTWFSVLCTSDSHFAPELAQLPSGKPNSYYISKRMAAAGEQAVPNLLTASDGATTNGNLLMANHFAQRGDPALYKMFVNRVIAAEGRPALSQVTFGRGNVLGHLAFDTPQPAREQHELVSVIMSAYNAADTIAYAARSILSQSHGNLELLICDDGSTDHTPKILAELRRDSRVRLFRSVAQQGTYNIRNNLIREARGTYLTFQDSDDFAFPDRIERQLAFLKREGAAAVAAQWFRITGDGEFVFSSEHAVARLAVVSLFAPRRVFERFGPYRPARFGADTEFYEGLRMRLGTDAVKLMPSPVIFGLSSATSLTRSAGIEATEDGFRAPARRAYAAAAARQRHLGGAHAGLPSPREVLEAHGVLMADAGVGLLEPGA
jgi:hypothetical protein